MTLLLFVGSAGRGLEWCGEIRRVGVVYPVVFFLLYLGSTSMCGLSSSQRMTFDPQLNCVNLGRDALVSRGMNRHSFHSNNVKRPLRRLCYLFASSRSK
jgi:hypothetical protein